MQRGNKKRIARSSHRFYSAFLRADRLATDYANIHRSTFLLIYLSGALALITAAMALAVKNQHHSVLILVILELLILIAIYTLYRRDHQKDFHDRWLEYRCIAEFLRPLMYMNLFGRNFTLFTEKSTSTAINREFIGHHVSARRWIYIYVAGVVRWAGFSYCPLNDSNKRELLGFVNSTWIRGQIDYQTQNAAKMQVVSRRLGKFSFGLFFATGAAVGLKLLILCAEIFLDAHFAEVLTVFVALLTAVFPVLATTAFAIRNHAEFDISAQRSLSMRAILIRHFRAFSKTTPIPQSKWINRKLRSVAYETITETSEWLEIYEVKESEPA